MEKTRYGTPSPINMANGQYGQSIKGAIYAQDDGVLVSQALKRKTSDGITCSGFTRRSEDKILILFHQATLRSRGFWKCYLAAIFQEKAGVMMNEWAYGIY